MSAAGQILAQVEEFVQGLLDKVHSHDAEQDARLTALETRVSALEPAKARVSALEPAKARVSALEPAKARVSALEPAKARASTARAGAAGVKAEAKDSK